MRKWCGGVVAMTVVMAMLGGCGPDGDRLADDMAERFVQQVSTNTCDDGSGFGIDQSTWTDACDAVVADLAPGTTLSAADVESGPGMFRLDFSRSVAYLDVDGVPSEVKLWFEGIGFMGHSGRLDFITSQSAATLGNPEIFQYEPTLDPNEPEGRAFIERVQSLVLDGRCPELIALMAPASEFPGTEDTTECEAVATMYAANPPTAEAEQWGASTYSVVDLFGPGTFYGVERMEGEHHIGYRDRVVRSIESTNKLLQLSTDDEDLVIEAVLHDGRWFLLKIEVETAFDAPNFRFDF